MKTALTLCNAIALFACAAAAHAADLVRRAVPVEAFHSIVLATAGDLHVSQGAGESLVIEAAADIIDKLRARASGGVLYLEGNGEPIATNQPIRFEVSAVDLRKIRGQGAGRITVEGLSAPSLALEVSGAYRVAANDLRADDLEVTLQGSGAVSMHGRVQRQRVVISGSTAYESSALASEEASVNISGSGSALVNAARQLRAVVSGSGGVRFLGNPTVESEVTGAGAVKRIAAN